MSTWFTVALMLMLVAVIAVFVWDRRHVDKRAERRRHIDASLSPTDRVIALMWEISYSLDVPQIASRARVVPSETQAVVDGLVQRGLLTEIKPGYFRRNDGLV